MSIIEVKNISKKYKDKEALKNVSLTFLPNKIYGLLGRNGAGKTTLLNTITNKIFASSGELFIDGENAVENYNAQSKIFHMTQDNLYPNGMKAVDAFKTTKEFYPDFNLEYAYELAKKFDFDIHKKMGDFSTGYNTIFKLIHALSVGTQVVIYDEPVSGLDANQRELFYKELISNYIEYPKTIILSTHLVEEISEFLEHVIVIKKGAIIINEPVEDLLQKVYSISGNSTDVDSYIKGKNAIKEETIGNWKSACIFQALEPNDREIIKQMKLDTASVKLQDLIISLTKS